MPKKQPFLDFCRFSQKLFYTIGNLKCRATNTKKSIDYQKCIFLHLFASHPTHIYPNWSQGVAFSRVHDLTQLMWEKTTQVGCGAHTCANGYSVFVCHYHPPGNQLGQSLFTQEHFLNLCRYEGQCIEGEP